jgi:GMP synthase (glutamine-hydrolysing)
MIEKDTQILIVDLGSQYTKVIKRSLRYLGFHSLILSPEKSLEWAENNQIKGIILSGGNKSVYDSDAPNIPQKLLSLNIPILGICYGMQWLAYVHDKDSIQNKREAKSYGATLINLDKNKKSKLFEKLYEKNEGNINAWASHGDSLKKVPDGFQIIATSNNGIVIEAMENVEKKFYGVEFHPEVEETEDENLILHNFINICGIVSDYSKKDIIEEIREKTKKELGDGVAIIGVSGGVDSTTLAAILAPALGVQLKAFMIDTGGMRKGEIEKVKVTAK